VNKYYKLLWAVRPPHPVKNLLRLDQESFDLITNILAGQEFAFDFEASGLDIWGEVFWVRSISYHNDDFSCSLEIRDPDGGLINHELEKAMFIWLSEQTGLVAHNYYYEGSVLYRATGKLTQAKCCTRKTYMDLANEGYDNQCWTLDEGMARLINWPANTTFLNKWLKDNNLTKGDMCQAPFDILGWYNQLDSAATWEMYKLFCQCIKDHEDTWGSYYWDYIAEDFMALLMLQIEAYGEGLTLDLPNLEMYRDKITKEMDIALAAFIAEPRVAKYIKEYEEAQQGLLVNKNDKHTKKGDINKNWQKFEDTLADKMEAVEFNVDSPPQIKWLLTKVFDITKQGKTYKVYTKEDS